MNICESCGYPFKAWDNEKDHRCYNYTVSEGTEVNKPELLHVEHLGRAGVGFAYKEGFRAGLEEAAKVCDDWDVLKTDDNCHVSPDYIAEAIRALKETKA